MNCSQMASTVWGEKTNCMHLRGGVLRIFFLLLCQFLFISCDFTLMSVLNSQDQKKCLLWKVFCLVQGPIFIVYLCVPPFLFQQTVFQFLKHIITCLSNFLVSVMTTSDTSHNTAYHYYILQTHNLFPVVTYPILKGITRWSHCCRSFQFYH